VTTANASAELETQLGRAALLTFKIFACYKELLKKDQPRISQRGRAATDELTTDFTDHTDKNLMGLYPCHR
jgi:hypothetical protein